MAREDAPERAEIINKYKRHESDVGSPEVQVALLTNRIEKLTKHFATHTGDTHSNKGMMNLISERKKLIAYLRQKDLGRYKELISSLGLRK
jgi:small subunit ribosomal protein S15